jgi:hypothetical protein
MDTKIYEINAYNRADMIHSKTYMVNLMDGLKPEAREAYRDHSAAAPAGYIASESLGGQPR